jgi:hypothetical protein
MATLRCSSFLHPNAHVSAVRPRSRMRRALPSGPHLTIPEFADSSAPAILNKISGHSLWPKQERGINDLCRKTCCWFHPNRSQVC